MLIVIPFCHKDYKAAANLCEWMFELDGRVNNHRCLLVGSHGLADSMTSVVEAAARKAFTTSRLVRTLIRDERGWPRSCNTMFTCAATYIHETLKCPFLWCEPDCVPLKKGWIDSIEEEYKRSNKPFMGAVVSKPVTHLTGCAVYPDDVGFYNHLALGTNNSMPWDCIAPELTLPHTHSTKLIQHVWSDENGKASTFDSPSKLAIVSSEAVLFHRCKDSSLIEAVRHKSSLGSVETYYHSGNLGDVIYALSAIQKHERPDPVLLIGPEQKGTSPCSNPITLAQFKLLKPLLDSLSYINETIFVESNPSAKYNLNEFRNHWNNWSLRKDRDIHNLCQMHHYQLGIVDKFNPKSKWIKLDAAPHDRIAIHRSVRYNNPLFPWKEIVQRFGKHLSFVGLEDEHKLFSKEFGTVDYRSSVDFLDMAKFIGGAIAFIGNQSFPCSLAIAQGQAVLQEHWEKSSDCLFQRKNFWTMNTPRWLDKIEQCLT